MHLEGQADSWTVDRPDTYCREIWSFVNACYAMLTDTDWLRRKRWTYKNADWLTHRLLETHGLSGPPFPSPSPFSFPSSSYTKTANSRHVISNREIRKIVFLAEFSTHFLHILLVHAKFSTFKGRHPLSAPEKEAYLKKPEVSNTWGNSDKACRRVIRNIGRQQG